MKIPTKKNFMKKNRVYIIAEAGVNHNGNLDTAKKLVLAAKKSGADAIKFQNFVTKELVTKNAKKAPYQIKNTKNKDNQFTMLKKLELKLNDYLDLKNFCKKIKIDFLTSVFDVESLNFVEKNLKPKVLKIPSGELTNFFLLDKINLKNYSIILSTGMSNINEIKKAINRITKKKIYNLKNNFYKSKNIKNLMNKISIMHCVTDYPLKNRYANLECINSMKKKLGFNIDYSDHTTGILAPLIAASKGSRIIEKHFTLNKKLSGPDHKISLDPKQLSLFVKCVNNTSKMLGNYQKKITASEKVNIIPARKSIYASKNIKKGEKFSKLNLTVKRPQNGIKASSWKKVINQKSNYNFKKNQLIKL